MPPTGAAGAVAANGRSQVDGKLFRSARPVDDNEPLDVVVDAPPPRPRPRSWPAMVRGILPDRPLLTSIRSSTLGLLPITTARAQPGRADVPTSIIPTAAARRPPRTFVDNSRAIVFLRRDLAEIETLLTPPGDNRRDRPDWRCWTEAAAIGPTSGTSRPPGRLAAGYGEGTRQWRRCWPATSSNPASGRCSPCWKRCVRCLTTMPDAKAAV